MSRARAARVERDEANEAMRQTVLQPDRRVEPDGDAGDRPPSASAQTHEHGEHHEHDNEAVTFPDHPTE